MPSKVLIIGLGFAGASLAKALDSDPSVELTCVEAREGFMLFKWGTLRGAVANGTWIDRSLLPTASLLKNGKIVRGRVVQVDSDARTVTLEDQSTLPYDVLVIATGARNLSPGEPPLAMTSKEDTVGFFRATRNAILESKDIVVLGAGPVAIELAGELRAYTKASMNVTLCPGEHPFLKNVIPPLPKQVQKSIRDMLKEAKITVVEGQVTYPATPAGPEALSATPMLRPKDGKVVLGSGQEIPCDLVLFAVGNTMSTGYLPSTWLDPATGEVAVDELRRVKGSSNVFCLGDAALTNKTKLGYDAMADATIVSANVLRVVQGLPPVKASPSRHPDIFLSMGNSKGRSFTSWGTFGGVMTTMFKSKGLWAGAVWGKMLSISPPKGA